MSIGRDRSAMLLNETENDHMAATSKVALDEAFIHHLLSPPCVYGYLLQSVLGVLPLKAESTKQTIKNVFNAGQRLLFRKKITVK